MENVKRQKELFWGLILFLIFIGIMAACNGCLHETQPKIQLLSMYDQYNAQYADYMVTTGWEKQDKVWVQTSYPILSEERLRVLREKKKVLTKVFPLILFYDHILTNDGEMPPDLLPKILGLLNQYIIY